jgi:acetyl-CoA C-acetyltransferase
MNSTLPGRVAVVNSAQTVLTPSWSDRQHIDLIAEAVSRALKGTGLRIDDIDFVIDSGSDFLDGRSISNCGFLGAMGAHHKEESRVEEDGLWSLTYAANKIACGSASVGLVIAYSKPSESDVRAFWTGLLEPFTQRPTGLDQLSAAGLYAQRYLAKAGIKADDLRDVVRHAWAMAARNPYVDVDAVPDDDAFWNEDVASPLRRSDLARPVDGAVAVLVAGAEVADQIAKRPVWLTGHGSAIDQHFLAAREPDSLPACTAATRTALRNAGDAQASEFDIVEVSATSSVGELMVLEAIGLAEAYRAIDLYRDGGPSTINPSGGALPADVIMATGLARLHEAASRLAGRTDYTYDDFDNARTALVHGTGGFGMQNHCVVTMEVAS